MFRALLGQSILKRAVDRELLQVSLLQLRDFAEDRHQRVDDAPFGGGPGMVLKADVLQRAVQQAHNSLAAPGRVVYLTPQGKRFDQQDAKRLAGLPHLILVCGHYEGVDERFVASMVDEEFSLGDFVLTGGEIPAMAIIDAVARLLPGVLGDQESFTGDSFYQGLLDYPHYTRPAFWQPDGRETPITVPAVLLSGHHGNVHDWRRRQALLRTLLRRPDWLAQANLSKAEKRLMELLADELDRHDPTPADGTNWKDQQK